MNRYPRVFGTKWRAWLGKAWRRRRTILASVGLLTASSLFVNLAVCAENDMDVPRSILQRPTPRLWSDVDGEHSRNPSMSETGENLTATEAPELQAVPSDVKSGVQESVTADMGVQVLGVIPVAPPGCSESRMIMAAMFFGNASHDAGKVAPVAATYDREEIKRQRRILRALGLLSPDQIQAEALDGTRRPNHPEGVDEATSRYAADGSPAPRGSSEPSGLQQPPRILSQFSAVAIEERKESVAQSEDVLSAPSVHPEPSPSDVVGQTNEPTSAPFGNEEVTVAPTMVGGGGVVMRLGDATDVPSRAFSLGDGPDRPADGPRPSPQRVSVFAPYQPAASTLENKSSGLTGTTAAREASGADQDSSPLAAELDSSGGASQFAMAEANVPARPSVRPQVVSVVTGDANAARQRVSREAVPDDQRSTSLPNGKANESTEAPPAFRFTIGEQSPLHADSMAAARGTFRNEIEVAAAREGELDGRASIRRERPEVVTVIPDREMVLLSGKSHLEQEPSASLREQLESASRDVVESYASRSTQSDESSIPEPEGSKSPSAESVAIAPEAGPSAVIAPTNRSTEVASRPETKPAAKPEMALVARPSVTVTSVLKTSGVDAKSSREVSETNAADLVMDAKPSELHGTTNAISVAEAPRDVAQAASPSAPPTPPIARSRFSDPEMAGTQDHPSIRGRDASPLTVPPAPPVADAVALTETETGGNASSPHPTPVRPGLPATNVAARAENPTEPLSSVASKDNTTESSQTPGSPPTKPEGDSVVDAAANASTRKATLSEKRPPGNSPASLESSNRVAAPSKSGLPASPPGASPRSVLVQTAVSPPVESNSESQVTPASRVEPVRATSPIEPVTEKLIAHRKLELAVRQTSLIRTTFDVVRTQVIDSNVCDVVQFAPLELAIIGKRAGTTYVRVWFKDQEQATNYLVTVITPEEFAQRNETEYEKLRQTIRDLYPRAKVDIVSEGDRIVVQGSASSNDEARQIVALVRKVRLMPVVDRLIVERRSR